MNLNTTTCSFILGKLDIRRNHGPGLTGVCRAMGRTRGRLKCHIAPDCMDSTYVLVGGVKQFPSLEVYNQLLHQWRWGRLGLATGPVGCSWLSSAFLTHSAIRDSLIHGHPSYPPLVLLFAERYLFYYFYKCHSFRQF